MFNKEVLASVYSFLKEGRTDSEYKNLTRTDALAKLANGNKPGYIDGERFTPSEAKSMYKIYTDMRVHDQTRKRLDQMTMSQIRKMLMTALSMEETERKIEEDKKKISSIVSMIDVLENKKKIFEPIDESFDNPWVDDFKGKLSDSNSHNVINPVTGVKQREERGLNKNKPVVAKLQDVKTNTHGGVVYKHRKFNDYKELQSWIKDDVNKQQRWSIIDVMNLK